MKLLVGLGNPGREYAGHRHNVGFVVVDRLSARLGIALGQQKFEARMGQGDAVVHISARHLAQLNLRLPREVEQTAIATVLTLMDAELTALEQRLAKTRILKQGVMQELLTGRARLV